jgi:hypothetical protein
MAAGGAPAVAKANVPMIPAAFLKVYILNFQNKFRKNIRRSTVEKPSRDHKTVRTFMAALLLAPLAISKETSAL